MTTTRLSSLQHAVLAALVNQGMGTYWSIEDVQHFDQRPFRSMLIRDWCAYTPGRGFHLTKAGKAAMEEFNTRDGLRKNPSLPLTSYFDPVAYGLDPLKAKRSKKAKLHAVPKRGAA